MNIEHNRTLVVNTIKGKLYNIQKDIKELEERTKKESVQKRIDDEYRMIANDIQEIRAESFKLEDKRKLLEEKIKKLQGNNRIILDEEKFLTKQLKSNI